MYERDIPHLMLMLTNISVLTWKKSGILFKPKFLN